MAITKTLKHYVANRLQFIMSCIDLAQVATTEAECNKQLDRAKDAIRQLNETLDDRVFTSIRKS